MNIRQAIETHSQKFKKVSDTAHLDAECLLMFVTGLSRAQLFSHPETELKKEQEKLFNELAQRRLSGEPIAYITGHKEFWDLDLKVTPDVLIPRPETECLVEWILENYSAEKHIKIADLGVGSGAIALAIAKERPNWQVDASDNSENALTITKENATKHNLTRLRFFKGGWCEALPEKDYDIIVSNPPYIAESDKHLKALKFEPHDALASGKEGLDAIKVLIKQAKVYLKPSGVLIFEHGYDQRDAVLALCNEAGYANVKDHDDLAGQPRFCTAIRE